MVQELFLCVCAYDAKEGKHVNSDLLDGLEVKDAIKKIIAEIETGVKEKNAPYEIVPDRREAIYKAVSMAKTNDVVIIAGKGHENYQEIRGARRPFSDVAVAREALAER